MAYCAVYLNRVYRERNCPEKPEDPLIMEKDIPYDADFTFIDFVPSVLSYSAQEVEFHKFSHLIEAANSWLRRNSHWKLINCETVKLSYRHNLTNMVSRWEQMINPATAMWNGSQLRTGEYETSLKVLRLWIRRKDIDEEDIEMINEIGLFAITLKYIDFQPHRIGGNAFESIDDILGRINDRLAQADARKWNLISLQSLKIEANSDWNLTDPEVSLAEESARHLIILRLYYEEFNYRDSELWPGSSSVATVGIEDFKPRHLSGGSFFKRPQFEPFSSLVQRSAKWLTGQTGVQFLNAQSIDVKVKSLSKVDSRSCTYNDTGDYIQILRVIFFKSNPEQSSRNGRGSPNPSRPRSAQPINSRQETSAAASMRLGSKVILTTKFEHPLDSLQHRILSWLRNDINADVTVLSAETVGIYGKDDDERNLERALEDCFQAGRLGSLNMYAFTAIRLFYCIVPKEEKTPDLGKSRLSLSAGTSRPSGNTPKLARQESMTISKRQRWPKKAAQEEGANSGGAGAKAAKLRHQLSTGGDLTVAYPNKTALLTRRPTQFDAAVAVAAVADFESKFGDQTMRPRSSSTSCNCM